jgi:hypothetical protein
MHFPSWCDARAALTLVVAQLGRSQPEAGKQSAFPLGFAFSSAAEERVLKGETAPC